MVSNQIYYSTIEQPRFAECWQQKLKEFPQTIINHCLKFHQIADQQRRFLGYALLKNHLANNGLSEFELNNISFHKNKKPFFTNLPNFHFSLSYSNELVVCAFSNQPIGVDIEKINPHINLENFKGVFNHQVWTEITIAPNPILAFYIYWTQMEAVSKADGIGITGPIHEIKYGKNYISINNKELEVVAIKTKENYISHAVGSNLKDLLVIKFEF